MYLFQKNACLGYVKFQEGNIFWIESILLTPCDPYSHQPNHMDHDKKYTPEN